MPEREVIRGTGGPNPGGIVDAGRDLGGRLLGVINPYANTVSDSTLSQSEYNFNSLVFPSDLGNEDVGHYMVININVPVKISGERRGVVGGGQLDKLLPGDYSKVDVLRFGQGAQAGGAMNTPALSIPRFTRRIAQSIGLFMPNGLVYDSENGYEEVSLTALAGGIGAGTASAIAMFAGGLAGSLAGGPVAGVATAGAVSIGAGAIAGAISRFGGVIGTVAQVAGYPINPRTEVLFSHTKMRRFSFQMLFAPSNEQESYTLNNIIRTLRFYSAPEIDPTTRGFTFIPPAEFDITFYNKGTENTTIPRINTSVLTQCTVDYAPASDTFSTFRNGHPVAVSLTLTFMEVELIHKLRVLQGF
jgi:hypothetical protein